MIKGCLALGMIQSTHQFPDFILKATEHFSLRLPSRIIPHHGHEGPHHQGTHPRRLIIVWPILHFVQFCRSSYSNRFILLQEVYTLPTRYAQQCLARTRRDVTRHISFTRFPQALLRRLPMAHTNWLRYTRVRGTNWHLCWTHVQQMSHGPSPASSPLHPASAELRRTRFQYAPSPEPILRNILLYGCSLAFNSTRFD